MVSMTLKRPDFSSGSKLPVRTGLHRRPLLGVEQKKNCRKQTFGPENTKVELRPTIACLSAFVLRYPARPFADPSPSPRYRATPAGRRGRRPRAWRPIAAAASPRSVVVGGVVACWLVELKAHPVADLPDHLGPKPALVGEAKFNVSAAFCGLGAVDPGAIGRKVDHDTGLALLVGSNPG